MKRKYHGWIVTEKGDKGHKDYFFCDISTPEGTRREAEFRDPNAALDWWDRKVGEAVKLEPTPLSAFRVYTEVSA